ncbi:MAG TPA: hypothetical protein VNN21_00135 [Dehalococcoidia bacterium]|nr:hypothetical protein [Dehalococcoidia bacterium]
MLTPADIQDPKFRAALEEADKALDEGDYARAARTCAETYLMVLEQHPELVPEPSGPVGRATGGSFASYLAAPRPVWPRTGGINIVVDSQRRPSLVYEKERFSFSEAAGYYEFLIGELWRLQQAAAEQK